MSKRTNNTMVAQGTKQQVSKILMGQMLTWAKRYTNLSYMPYSYKASQIETSAITRIMRSGYERDSITSWASEDFDFRFEYGRRGGVRVSYMNNQGLQSAVFQASEWRCMMDYISRKIQNLLDAEKAKEEEEQRKAEEERFQRAVENAVLKALGRDKCSNLYRAIDDIAELAAEKVVDEQNIVDACKEIRKPGVKGEVSLKSEMDDLY